MRILIADDDITSRFVVSAALRQAGYEIVEAEDGEGAWHILQEPNPPQLAVLDWMMPKLDGLEVVRRVRSNSPAQPKYLILLTALQAKTDIVRGLKAGADDYVSKPFDPAELRARVQVGARVLELQNSLADRVGELETALTSRQTAEAGRLLLATAVEQAADGVFITDAHGRIQYANPAFSRMTGYTCHEVIGQNPRLLRSGKQHQEYYRQLWETILAGQIWHGELVNRRKDGTLYAEEMTITPVCDASGVITNFIAVKHDVTERKGAEASLRASESRYRLLFETNIAAIIRSTLDGRIVDCNGPAARLLGYESPQEMLGLSMKDIHCDPELRAELMSRLQAEKTIAGVEVRLRHREGRPIWVFFNLSLASADETGEALVQGTLVDITQRMQAEEGLRTSEEQFRQLAETIREVFFVSTPEPVRVTYVSPAYEEIWGRPRREIYERPAAWIESIHEEDRERAIGVFARSQQGSPTDMEYRIFRPDGTIRWIRNRTFPANDSQGRFSRVVGIAEDITERKRVQDELHQSRQMLQSILDTIPQRVFWKDRNGSFLGCNRALAMDAGLENPAEIIGKSDFDLSWSEFAELYRADDKLVMEHETPKLNYEEQLSKPDGSLLWLRTNKLPLRDREGKVIGVIGTYEDITDRKRAEAALEQAARLDALRAEIGAALTRGGTLRSGLQECAEALVRHLDVAFGRIWVLEESSATLVLEASAGMYTHLNGPHGRVPVGAFKIGRIAESGEPHLSNSVLEDPWVGDLEWARREGMVAFAGYPLKVGDRVLGVAAAFARQPLTDAALQVFAPVASSIAQFIQGKRAEESLRESEDRFRTAFEEAPYGMCMVGLDGRFLSANAAFCRMVGHSSDELLAGAWRAITHPEDLEHSVQMEDLLNRGVASSLEFEKRYIHKQGNIIWARLKISVVRDSLGRLSRYISQIEDITLRKQAEEAQAFLASLVESSQDAINGANMEGIIVSWNRGAEELYGYNAQEIIGKPVSVLIPSDCPDQLPQLLRRILHGERISGYESVRIRKDGRRVDVSLTISPVFDASGKVTGAATIARNITERKRAEQALQRSEAYLAESQRLSHVGSWAWDVATREIIYWSPEHYRIFGFDKEKGSVSFATALERVHPEDRRAVGKVINNIVIERKDFEWDFRLLLPDGSTKNIHGTGHPVTNERGEMVELVGTHADVTERKRTEARLTVQYRTARALAESETLAEAVPRILQAICEPLGWDYGIHWDADWKANVLRWAGSWHTTLLDLTEAENVARELTSSPGAGMCGRVWATGRPLWFSDLGSHQLERADVLEQSGLRSAVAFPIVVGTKVLSTIQLFSRAVRPEDSQTLELLMTVSGQIGPLIERQRAEEALNRSEERAQLLFATIPHPTYVFDLDTLDFLEVNDAAVERYGYSRDEFLRMKVTGIRSTEEAERFRLYLPQLRSHIRDSGQWRHRTKGGRILDVEITSHALDYDGHKAAVVIAQDVTQSKRLELELRHSQKLEAVGSLASGIAHELNTPIQFVGDNTYFLQDAFRDLGQVLEKYGDVRDAAARGTVPPALLEELAQVEAVADVDYLREEIPKALEQSLDGVTRVAKIVRAMKEFAHPDRSEKMATDLNKSLESTLTVARNEIKYVADTETDFGELPLVLCHGGDINQVFLNLLVNAAHAITDVVKPGGGRGLIRVRTRQEGNDVLISISDSGSGIPENIRNNIFEPFFTTKDVGRGTGQGLAIARSVVVDKHGGSLTFETEVGRGTTFHIRLPIDPGTAVGSGGANREQGTGSRQ